MFRFFTIHHRLMYLCVCVMMLPFLSVPCLTMWAPTGGSHQSSLASGAKYALHLVLSFSSPPWPKPLCFVCIMIVVHYEYIMTSNCAWLACPNTELAVFSSGYLHIWNCHLKTLSICFDLLNGCLAYWLLMGRLLCFYDRSEQENQNLAHFMSFLVEKKRIWPLRKLGWHQHQCENSFQIDI